MRRGWWEGVEGRGGNGGGLGRMLEVGAELELALRGKVNCLELIGLRIRILLSTAV